jgi:hypothetical protein
MAGIFVGLNLLLVRNGKSAAIINLHVNETPRAKLIGRLSLFAYIISSIAMLIGTWTFMAVRNHFNLLIR